MENASWAKVGGWVDALVERERDVPEVDPALFRRCVKATRGLAIAEALLLVMAGFTLDDLDLLRVPGYALGATLALLVLAGGGLLHGRRLARRVVAHSPDRVDESLHAARLRNVLAAIAASLAFLAWLVFFSAGVPPWAL